MKVITVAHGHPSLHKGGGEVAAYSMHQMLRNAGHQSVFVGWGGAATSVNGGSLTKIGDDDYLLYTASDYYHFSSQSNNLREALEALLDAYQPDVVHFHHYIHVGIEAASIVKLISPKTKTILTLHEYLAICLNNGQMFTKKSITCDLYKPENCSKCFPDRSPNSIFMREIAIKSAFGYIDHFVSPSEFLVNQYVKWGIPSNKISAIENPLPFRGDDSLAVKESARKSGEWRIGFFGQINYYKGVDIIVDAVKSLKEKGKKIKLGIHGNFVSIASDSYVDNLKLEISELSDCITYYGPYPQDDVIGLMQEYDFIVMGSRWYENSPVVIQEAIAAGVPMIVPDHGGMKEKVEDFGFVYKPSNFAAMVAVLDDMTERKYMQSKKKVFAMRAKQKDVLNESYNKICEIYMK